ncbi:MAG: response regulator [Pseudomonadota bacterium]
MADIMILEDDRQLSRRWKGALTGVGHTVEIVETASEGLALAREKKFDLCIVDIFIKRDGAYVPDGGVILISKFRQVHPDRSEPWWSTVPIIAITGASGILGGYDPLRTARDMGANLMIRKPIPLNEMMKCVEDLLNGAEGSAAGGGGAA